MINLKIRQNKAHNNFDLIIYNLTLAFGRGFLLNNNLLGQPACFHKKQTHLQKAVPYWRNTGNIKYFVIYIKTLYGDTQFGGAGVFKDKSYI